VQARYRIADTTLWRWLRKPSLKFPRPLVINRMRYFRLSEIEEWEQNRPRLGLKD
jgi:predicted DNA-binding transcriptional regulator AlpA